MSHSSILGGNRAPQQAPGRDADTLGPSDSSDSGSDVHGARRMKTVPEEGLAAGGALPIAADSDSDAEGTGERAEAVPEGARDGADIAPDRIARSTRPSRSPATTTRSSRLPTTATKTAKTRTPEAARRRRHSPPVANAGGRHANGGCSAS
jgi:hypothetical protein